MSKLELVNDSTFDEKVLASAIPVVVDFYAPWCAPCRQLAPLLESVAGDNDGKVLFVKVNVDESTELATKYSINSLPTVITFKDGKVVEEHYGVVSKATLKDSIQKLLA